MQSQGPAAPFEPNSPLRSARAQAPAVLNPRSPIEVASPGSSTVHDPSAIDTKPPGCVDLDLTV